MKVDVQKCHACHATSRSMSKSATPATQHEGRCQKVPRLPWSSLIHVLVGWGGVGWDGVGWGGVIMFMFLCTHGRSNLIIFLAVQQTQALLFHDQLPVGWGGVGWGNNVHVPVHTEAQQPYHLSCCPADTGTAHSWSVTGGVGWGGVG